ncbi:MAG: hypothetical protein WA869_22275 [Alloacidobacterium sp.]|jgi:hypothetical protein
MELGFDRRLAIGGLVVSIAIAIAGLGITILWPDKKELGWFFLFVAAFIFYLWLVFEIVQWFGKTKWALVYSAAAVIIIFGVLVSLYLHERNSPRPEDEAKSPPPPNPSVSTSPSPLRSPEGKEEPEATAVQPTKHEKGVLASKVHARLRVTEVSFQNDSSLPHLNIFYDNAGPITAKGFLRSYAIISSNVELSPFELLQKQNENDQRASTKALNDVSSSYIEMSPGDRPNFISVQGHLGEEADRSKNQ